MIPVKVLYDGHRYIITFRGKELIFTQEEMDAITSRLSAIREFCQLVGYPPVGFDESFQQVGGYFTKDAAAGAKSLK